MDDNPYRTPKSSQPRTFKTPLIVPLSVIGILCIYGGYTYYFFYGESTGLFDYLIRVSFEVFLLCEFAIITILLYNKKKLDDFLREFPTIDSPRALERLKPIARTNMYSALFQLLFMGLGALMAVMAILNRSLTVALAVAVLSMISALLIRRYNRSEEQVKQIECKDAALEAELRNILDCWLHKALPSF